MYFCCCCCCNDGGGGACTFVGVDLFCFWLLCGRGPAARVTVRCCCCCCCCFRGEEEEAGKEDEDGDDDEDEDAALMFLSRSLRRRIATSIWLAVPVRKRFSPDSASWNACNCGQRRCVAAVEMVEQQV